MIFEFNGNKIDASQTYDKYLEFAEPITCQVFKLLEAINVLELKTYAEHERMESEKETLGIPSYQEHPDSRRFFESYADNYYELIKPLCSEKLIKRTVINCFSKPPKYFYIKESFSALFIMKSGKKAVIETYFVKGINMKHQFSIKLINDKWKIDEVKYGFSASDSWHTDHI